jgi:hypothetical protein
LAKQARSKMRAGERSSAVESERKQRLKTRETAMVLA